MAETSRAPSSLMRIYDHPNCPTCGSPTLLSRIEPAEPNFEIRTFNCATCGNELNLTVKFNEGACLSASQRPTRAIKKVPDWSPTRRPASQSVDEGGRVARGSERHAT